MDIAAIESRVIDLGNEDSARIFLLDLRNHPVPEIDRHHEHHVATEAIDTLLAPVQQDIEHFGPSVRHRVEVIVTATTVIDAIVELHGLIPVVLRR